MNGINAPKVIECEGSDGHRYRQLAKSGNDDLRQDAVRFQKGNDDTIGTPNTFFLFLFLPHFHQILSQHKLGILSVDRF